MTKRPISLIITLTIILTSCALPTIRSVNPSISFTSVDFSKYSQEGFYITPERYDQAYIPIGLVQLKISPQARYVYKETITNKEGYEEQKYSWIVEPPNLEMSIDSLVSMSKKMGANAIMNFRYDYYTKEVTRVANPVSIEGVRVSGFAIKRKALEVIISD